MGEVVFSVESLYVPECDQCDQPAEVEVSIVGSPISHQTVCSAHKQWAKQQLVDRDTERRRKLNLCIRCGLPDNGTVDSCDCTPAEKIASGQ